VPQFFLTSFVLSLIVGNYFLVGKCKNCSQQQKKI
jgi:hypothetical protein